MSGSASLREARCFACEEGVPLVNVAADRADLPDLWAHQYGGEPGTTASCPRTDRGTLREPSSSLLEARIMASDASRAVGRFELNGPSGYRAATAPNAPLRTTRAAATEDEREWLDA